MTRKRPVHPSSRRPVNRPARDDGSGGEGAEADDDVQDGEGVKHAQDPLMARLRTIGTWRAHRVLLAPRRPPPVQPLARWTSSGRSWPRSGWWPSTGISSPPSSRPSARAASRLETGGDRRTSSPRLACEVKQQARPLPLHLPARHHHRQPRPRRRHRAGRRGAARAAARLARARTPRAGARHTPRSRSPSRLAISTALHVVVGEQAPEELGHPLRRPAPAAARPAAGRLHVPASTRSSGCSTPPATACSA